MALVFKKIAEYEWQVKVKTPYKGKFKEESFTAKFKNVGRKNFNELIDGGDDHFVKTVLLGWSGIKDEDGNEIEFNDENFEAIIDNVYIVQAVIAAYGESMQGALVKN